MNDAGSQSINLFHGAYLNRRRSLIAGAVIVCFFYLLAAFADFFSPYDYRSQSRREPFAPPALLRFRNAEGKWNLRPFIYQQRLVDPLTRRYEMDTSREIPLELFTVGYEYKLFGLFRSTRHLYGISAAGEGAQRVCLLGTDVLGRDMVSRLIVAARFTLLVGPLGTFLAAILGVLIGCLAGYAKGRLGNLLDGLLMRLADTMMAMPALVTILACRAAFPLDLPPMRAAMLIIGIFIILGWAEMARLTRGLVLELRDREFVLAARSIGMSEGRILLRHILPNAARPLIVQTLLMLPAFLLAETTLSFLGVGLQEPDASWGGLLAAAADGALLESGHSWTLLMPALAITLFVLGVRLIGSALEQRKD